MRKKYSILLGLLTCLVSLSFIIMICLLTNATSSEEINLTFMEISLDDDEMLNLADIVVKGKIVNKVDEIIYSKGNLEATVSIYKFLVTECFYGDLHKGDEILISFGGTILPQETHNNSDLIVYFKKNTIDYKNTDIYSFVSVSQGIFSSDVNMENSIGEKWNLEKVLIKIDEK